MKRFRRLFSLVAALFITWSAAAATAVADEYCFAMIFGSESQPKRLRYTHTWITFVRAVGEGPDLNSYALELNTISWLPRTLEVKVLRPWPEPGINLELYQSLKVVMDNQESVTMWGPFVVDPALFRRSLMITQVLNSGAARYRAISTARNILVTDCIHAVAAIDPIFGRRHYPLIRIGKPASRYIAHEAMQRSMFDQYLYDNSWLIPRLGLNTYPIEVVPPQAIPKAPCGLCRQSD